MIDLHLHTTCSDGLDSPESLVERACDLQIEAIAITDHDAVTGVRLARAPASERGIRLVPGVELSAVEGRSPVHVLGYGIDPDDTAFEATLAGISGERHVRAKAIVARLHGMGVPLQMAAVEYAADGAPITRAHIAQALVLNGLVKDYADAFHRYLANDSPAYIPQGQIGPVDAIRLIHEAGGVAVMAHPVLTRRDELIAGMIRAGLDGIEIIHPTHTESATRFYHALARKHHLLVTGGSDAHGTGRGSDLIGRLTAPVWMLQPLFERIDEMRTGKHPAPLETAPP